MCFKYVKCAIYEFELSTSYGKYEDLASLITLCEEDIIRMNTTIDHICNTTTSSTEQQPYYC